MDFREKQLYHQIHPIKLMTDWITGTIALYLLWHQQLLIALCVMFIPSVIVSVIIIKYINLKKLKDSTFGMYIRVSMTKSMELVRFVGFAIAIFGAWYHMAWLIVSGYHYFFRVVTWGISKQSLKFLIIHHSIYSKFNTEPLL